MRYYGFRSELGRAHGKNLKIHVIFRTEDRPRKGVTYLESYVKYTIVKYSKNIGDKFIKKI